MTNLLSATLAQFHGVCTSLQKGLLPLKEKMYMISTSLEFIFSFYIQTCIGLIPEDDFPTKHHLLWLLHFPLINIHDHISSNKTYTSFRYSLQTPPGWRVGENKIFTTVRLFLSPKRVLNSLESSHFSTDPPCPWHMAHSCYLHVADSRWHDPDSDISKIFVILRKYNHTSVSIS